MLARANGVLSECCFLILTACSLFTGGPIGCGAENLEDTSTAAESGGQLMEYERIRELTHTRTYGTSKSTCTRNEGCVQGFFSDSFPISLVPDLGKLDNLEDGPGLDYWQQTGILKFVDSEELIENFQESLVWPLLQDTDPERHRIRISPRLGEGQFFRGFHLQVGENLDEEAPGDTLTMPGQGNFILENTDYGSQLELRAQKNFLIQIEPASSSTEVGTYSKSSVCLRIYLQISEITIREGEISPVGGLRNFDFSYSDDTQDCLNS